MGKSSLFRFSLRALLLLVAITALATAMVAHYFFGRDPITHITTRSEWDAAMESDRCIVFVDGEWNVDMVAFRQPYAKFAEWCQSHIDARALTMLIDSDNTTNDVWSICNELWRMNSINPGGLKNYGGAGRVLWINKGQVVDYAWCMELINYEDIENIDTLKARTQNAFN
jgi:hypothetical protein